MADLGFKIEARGDTSVVVWSNSSCRPASAVENTLWAEIERYRHSMEVATDDVNKAEAERDEARGEVAHWKCIANGRRYIEAEAQRDALAAALVGCASILESLAIAVKWEIAPSIMEEIRMRALPAARAALAGVPRG